MTSIVPQPSSLAHLPGEGVELVLPKKDWSLVEGRPEDR